MLGMKSTFLGVPLLALALVAGLPACDSKNDAPDKREDEGGDEKPEAPEKTKAKDDAEDEEDEARLSDDGNKATPTPATDKPDTPATKTGDFKTADQFGKPGAGTTGDETKKVDDGAGATPGANPIGATPIKSDKRGEGSAEGGECPCIRGFVCCSGVCKRSCS